MPPPPGQQAKRIGANLRGSFTTACKALALAIDAELRKNPSRGGTPVKTGHARANWVPAVGQQHQGEVEGNAAHDAGVASIAAYQLASGKLFVSNSVPYIQALNYGHSKQAPRLFIEAAVDRAMTKIRAKFVDAYLDVSATAFRQEMGAQGAAGMASSYSPFGGDDD